MNVAQKRDYAQLKSKLPVNILVRQWLSDGKQKGKEWLALNPMRNDSKPGSFSINLNTGVWSDFACPDVGGNDMISLYAYLNGCEQSKAYDDLNEIYGHGAPIKKQKPHEDDGVAIIPVPSDAGEPPPDNRSALWCYKNTNNEVLLYVARYESIDNKGNPYKITPAWTYRQYKDGSKRWALKSTDVKLKPLYNLYDLILLPESNVLLVEGEKATEAAKRLMPGWVCMTWMGGCNQVDNVDFSFLKDREVILWPDNDKGGILAMQKASLLLKNIAKHVNIIDMNYLNKKIKGWDLADGEQEGVTEKDILWVINESSQEKELQAFPFLSAKNNPLNMPENVDHLMKHYNVTLRFNEITKKIDAEIPHSDFSSTNREQLILIEFKRLCIIHNVPKTDLENWLLFLADKNRYNPVKEWITSKPWDKVTRFNNFANTLQCSNNQLRDILLKRWMVGAITVAYNEKGRALHGVLTLLGETSLGKSSWIKALIPQELNLMVRDFSLNPADKDSVMQATGNWLSELSEVDSMVRKVDVASTKAFLTRDIDIYRAPYARGETRAPRRTAFLASVNDDKFLRDATGNRRWWVLETVAVNYEHTFDMQQVWAEIEHYYYQGEKSFLSRDEENLLNLNNEIYTAISPLQEKLLTMFDWDNAARQSLNCTQILFQMGYEKPNDGEPNKLASILKKLKIDKDTGKRKRNYFIPFLIRAPIMDNYSGNQW